MYKIVARSTVGLNLEQYEVEAPRVAKSRQCGQFAIIRPFDHSERIPLTIASVDKEKGTITFIAQIVGKTTKEMSTLGVGDYLCDVAGPLGEPSEIVKYESAEQGKEPLVVVVGGGLGTAVVYPQAVALKECGNKVVSIVGARSKDLLLMTDRLGEVSEEVICTTNDGSAGRQGFVTDALKDLIENPKGNTSVAAVYTAGPVIMMKAVSDLTKPYGIKTIVSLNPIMVDGTGMCGGCRVTIGGETKFACVDGPEFDGHLVDFVELMGRLSTYREKEQHKLEKYEKNHKCRMMEKADKLGEE